MAENPVALKQTCRLNVITGPVTSSLRSMRENSTYREPHIMLLFRFQGISNGLFVCFFLRVSSGEESSVLIGLTYTLCLATLRFGVPKKDGKGQCAPGFLIVGSCGIFSQHIANGHLSDETDHSVLKGRLSFNDKAWGFHLIFKC